MAIEVNAMDCRLQIQLDTGAAPDGSRVLRTRTFNRVKATASNQGLFDTAYALISMQKSTPISIRRIGTDEMVNV